MSAAARRDRETGATGFATLMADTELLCAEEEVALAFLIEAGLFAGERLSCGVEDPALRSDLLELQLQGRRAFDRFVRANVRLAAWHARRWAAAGGGGALSVEDLTSEGILGVIRAVQKWDYRRGLKFSTYAVYWVRQFQHRAVLRSCAVVLTFADHEDCRRLLQARAHLTEQLRHDPTVGELAEELGSTRRRVEELLRMLQRPLSLDQPVGVDPAGSSLGDQVSDRGGDVDEQLLAIDTLRSLLAGLDPRERAVLAALFGLDDGVPHTVEEVAAMRRVPTRLVASTAEAAMGKLRQAAANCGAAA